MAGENAGATGTSTTTGAAAGGAAGTTGAASGDSTTTTGTTTAATLLGGAAGGQAADAAKVAGATDGTATQQAGEVKPLELKLPDGFDPKDPLLGGFSKLAAEKGMKAEQAQAVLDFYAKDLKQALEDGKKAELAARAEQSQKWLAAVKSDKDIGGANLEASVKAAGAAMTKFGTPELRQELDRSGLGDHPAFVKFFAQVGKALGESSTAGAMPNGTSAPQPVNSFGDLAERLYK